MTRLYDRQGGAIEVTDFAPRFGQYGRMFRPMMLVRRIRRAGRQPAHPVRLRPASGYGRAHPAVTWGSNHIRYVMPAVTLRLTTDASLTAILEETPFFLEDTVTLLLGPDETVPRPSTKSVAASSRRRSSTGTSGCATSRIPFEWQDAVIRAAITLKLNAYDDTGAIVAAMTTSIPEAAGSGRNWDYRYCWLRDGYFVVNALNRLGATDTMERYLGYIVNIAADRRRAAAAGLSASTASRAGRARRDVAAGLSRHGAGAHRQPGLPPGAARRLWFGHPRGHPHFLRPAPDPARRRSAVPPPRTPGRAGDRRLRPAGCRAVGVARQRSACTPSPA